MFGNDSDIKNVILVIGGIMLLTFIMNSINSGEFMNTLLILPGLVLGLTVHEFSHAKMADRLGDPTPGYQGRLTLNPLAHMDIMGTICLLIADFGWGKPVQVNSTYFRNPQRDNMLVALAGPLSNFIIAFVLFVAFGFLYYLLPIQDGKSWADLLLAMVYLGAKINLTLCVFNLLPFPPLDGSKILGYFLKGKARSFIWTLEKYSLIILMILFITELPSLIIIPVVEWIAHKMQVIAASILVLFM